MNVKKQDIAQLKFMVNVTVHAKLIIETPYGDFIPCLIVMYPRKKR